jgi:vacuolar-type H+-ATPase subunit C/Vma6
MAKSILKDPLGIGVLLGYLALKLNEISNLRWIAHAIHARVNVGQIHEGLEVIS